MANTPYKTIFCTQISFDSTTTGGKTADLHGAHIVIMRSTADCYVDFDQPVASTQSYKIPSANTADTTVEVDDGTMDTLYVQGVSGTGTLYVIVIN